MATWVEAVTAAIGRHVAAIGSATFTRQIFIEAELAAIVAATGTSGLTPAQTLGRELQQLRDVGRIDFVAPGKYRWLGEIGEPAPAEPTSVVLVLGARADTALLPEQGFAFDAEWVSLARRTVGQWVIYQGSNGYGAVARVERVDSLADRPGSSWARINTSDYLEFGHTVPLERDGRIVEHGLVDVDNLPDRARARQPMRRISHEDVDRILALGLVAVEQVSSPSDTLAPASLLQEQHTPFEGRIDRTTMLVNRKVRDQQFRRRVLDAYGSRCALTGMKIINGGGRAETEAAHIMSVEAGGPDAVNNGIALSRTMHWMFDRGLISLTDEGEIMLSRAINDLDSVERLIHRDRKARLPVRAAQRPHPRYLDWHRTYCFHN